MTARPLVAAFVVTFALTLVSAGAGAHLGEDDHGSACHVHQGAEEMHCHFEIPLADELLQPPHPLVATVDRVVRVVAGVVAIDGPVFPDVGLDVCATNEDCPGNEKCIAAVCTEPVFQPLGTMVDTVQMSMKIGGPGAVLRLRW